MARELVHVKSKGWGCGWVRLIPRLADSDDEKADAKKAFDAHDCSKYPLPKNKKSHEDVNQAAAWIVREATDTT